MKKYNLLILSYPQHFSMYVTIRPYCGILTLNILVKLFGKFAFSNIKLSNNRNFKY